MVSSVGVIILELVSNIFTEEEEEEKVGDPIRSRSTPPVHPPGGSASVYGPNGRVRFSIDTAMAAAKTMPR